jgi:hypothetical protein
MSLLRSLRILGTDVLQICRVYGAGFTDDRPVNPAAARIATLTAASAAFGKVINTPRGQIVNKSALLREVETDTAALVQLATDMDDLALQFDGTDAGKRFIEAWKRARIIVDTGGGHSGTPPTPPTPPATPGK